MSHSKQADFDAVLAKSQITTAQAEHQRLRAKAEAMEGKPGVQAMRQRTKDAFERALRLELQFAKQP